jgi:cytochrome c oxidase cbb3-type subunit 1
MPALSSAATTMTLLAFVAVFLCIRGTAGSECGVLRSTLHSRFIVLGMAAYLVASLAGVIVGMTGVGEIMAFTWFEPARLQLFIYGFFVMVMFGGIYYIAPRVAGVALPFPKLVAWHFWLSAAGVVILVLPQAIGGIKQGFSLNGSSEPIVTVTRGMLPFLRASTTGDFLLLFGHLLLLVNLGGLAAGVARATATQVICGGKPVEVAS